MHNPENANAEAHEHLTDIIRAATQGPISEADARLICWGCGIDSKYVVPPKDNQRENHGTLDK